MAETTIAEKVSREEKGHNNNVLSLENAIVIVKEIGEQYQPSIDQITLTGLTDIKNESAQAVKNARDKVCNLKLSAEFMLLEHTSAPE